MAETKKTEISQLGRFGLIERLTKGVENRNKTSVQGVGDDAAIIDLAGEHYTLITTDMLLEGVNFDLVYFPLKHLGYKAIVSAINNIYAMNGTPTQVLVSVGVSAKLSVEHLEELYQGIALACQQYGVDLVGGDTKASVTGLVLSTSAVGRVDRNKVAYRSGACLNDLICVTGDLGAAYMGLHLLEREKRAFSGNSQPQPQFEGYEHLLRSQLQPIARKDIIEALGTNNIKPTSMIDLTNGLASDLLQICRASNCGVRIYMEHLPIAQQTHKMADELNSDSIVAALNGGDDHQLLFTVPLELRDKLSAIGGIEVIGHITESNSGAYMITPDGGEVPLTAPGIG